MGRRLPLPAVGERASDQIPHSKNSAATPIGKSERDDLRRLIQQREKVLKSAAKQRTAELLADFENQIGSEFSFDDDAVWTKATRDAEAEVARTKQRIA